MELGVILLGILLLAYIYLYVSGKHYGNEGFYNDKLVDAKLADAKEECKSKDTPGKTKVIMEQHIEAPYLTSSILDVDDYDYNLVFQNEGDRDVSQSLINKLQSQYPMDWSNQPPSSAHFQAGQQRLAESFLNTTEVPDNVLEIPYKEITGQSLQPPDTTLQEMEERKILQTYVPVKSDSLTTYNLEDARDLIKKTYDAKGLIPDVRIKGNNVFEVIGTRRKDEKIVYEDEEAPAQRAPLASAGEATITVPATAVDVAAGLDPFYSPSQATRKERWDYQKFTPGLERMFAPTYPTMKWS